MLSKTLSIALIVGSILCAALWGFLFGLLNAPVEDTRLQGYTEVYCNDITQSPRGVLVCEINLEQEDDNIKIYRGAYGV